MNKKFIIPFLFIWILFFNTNFAQKKYQLLVLGGPSITSINEYWNGDQIFPGFPERPFYRITGHGGFGVEKKIGKIYGRTALMYERIGSSSVGFNKEPNEHVDLLVLPISVLIPPVSNQRFKLEFGMAVTYLLNTTEFSPIGKEFRTFRIASVAGIECKLLKNASINVKWMELLTRSNEKVPFEDITTGLSSVVDLEKSTQSFQFSLIYKFNL